MEAPSSEAAALAASSVLRTLSQIQAHGAVAACFPHSHIVASCNRFEVLHQGFEDIGIRCIQRSVACGRAATQGHRLYVTAAVQL